jgi:hypothetical protein
MKYSFLVLILISVLSCAGSSNDEIDFAPEEKKENLFGVVLNENAALRFQPQLYTTRIDEMDKGENVRIISRSAERSKIGGVTEYWYFVQLPSGITGWTFGSNLKVLREGDEFSIEDYRKQVNQEKVARTMKQLKGKWWSVTASGSFTSHMLMLYPDYTYKSTRGGLKKEGLFSLDMEKKLITFSEGTSFNDTLGFYERGQELVLEIETDEQTYRFKKIAAETDKEEEERLEQYQIEDLEQQNQSQEESSTGSEN